ncbi:hypothetical protein STSP2_03464 [Anaerohalosphaera lusitana]|uniref:Flavinylation-associated cytochrome domain-containing protein n=1 Tax=Anaerohalosphaera lusitana TaxID=1936003 RepID=A0A1U9NRB3_9BACT|nr:DUF4405 domain-containing protein [Anaerohalosphaera lusitana]AQT70258.1 hypothetical protein STSP2_03464 [Anaerohalosphaera lusitana]
MKRSSWNFAIDLFAFLVLLALTATGVVIRFVLPPGSGGRGQLQTGGRGREHIQELLGMTRDGWGSIHFYISLLFIVLMLAHLFLHWNWVKGYMKNCFRRDECEDK